MTDTAPAAARADTPVPQPPSKAEAVKSFLGDLARPFAIYAVAGTTAFAVVDKGTDANKLGAAGLILAALYAGKTIEKREETRQAAQVEIAKAAAPSAVVVASAAPADGELPASQQIR